MDSDPTKPAAQVALDELRAEATTPEEHAYLDQEQAALTDERQAALGGKVVESTELVELKNGAIVPKDDVDQARERGEDVK